jgi:hypothetical protein
MHLATPAERHPVGGDLQRADHRRLIPLALRGVPTGRSARRAAARNLLIYGVGGLIVPFIHRHQADRPGLLDGLEQLPLIDGSNTAA